MKQNTYLYLEQAKREGVEDMKYTIVEDIWILIEVLQVLVLLDLRNYLLKSGAEGRACTDPGTTTMRLK